jgi:hypothetical protein
MSDFLKEFKSPRTGRTILLNTSPESFVWIEVPTVQEVEAILTEHESIRIDERWETLRRERLGTTYIEAFATTTAGALANFRHESVATLIGTSQVRNLAAVVHALTLGEQRTLLDRLKPSSRKDFEATFTTRANVDLGRTDLRPLLSEASTVESFVDKLVAIASGPRVGRSGAAEQATEILTMLRARSLLLFPASFRNWTSSVKLRTAQNARFSRELATLVNDVNAYCERSDGNRALSNSAQTGILVTSLNRIDDLTGELVEAIEVQLQKVAKKSESYRAGQAFRELWNRAYPGSPFARTRTRARKEKEHRRTSGEFSWLSVKGPCLSGWQTPLASFVSKRTGQTKHAVVSDLNIFCNFLLTLRDPPSLPEKVDRASHIFDATFVNNNTFMHVVAQTEYNGKRKTRILGYLRDFFSWYRDWLVQTGQQEIAATFVNPVSEQDKFKQDDNPGQTYRTALPNWLLKELKKTLTENDFAFPKSEPRTDWVNQFDAQEGKVTRVWWPGTATVLALLLELPLRSHQSRWLDSGDFDEMLYDFNSQTEVKNPNPLAIPGRRESCIRKLHDSLRLESWPGLYVNTNKTALYDGRRPPGYEIPYLTEGMAQLLSQMQAWNKRYLPPLASLVTYREEARGNSIYSSSKEVKLPQIAPLFRDPSSAQKVLPPSYEKVARLYVRVLAETEKRIKAERGIDIALTKIRTDGTVTWRYDLHTLRVSGISAMIESGVPLEVVSQFIAGHASLVMTLWYLKHSPGKIRDAIAKAHLQLAQEEDFISGKSFAEHIEEFSPFLLSQNLRARSNGDDVAFIALKEHTGLWTIATDGICPGTSCSTGGPPEAGQQEHGPVPGGRRCGLCRYWLTGPSFLLGQVAETNNLIYKIRRRGLELKTMKDRLIDLQDSEQHSSARAMRSRIELMEKDLTLDISEWQSRYSYAMQSSEKLEEYLRQRMKINRTDTLPAPLFTVSSAEDLKVTLQETDDFGLLEHVTQMYEFVPGFKNREATLDKHRILSKLLQENGMNNFLLPLDDEHAEAAGNLLSALIMEYVDAQDRTRLFNGEMKLSDLPALDSRINSITEEFAGSTALSAPSRRVIPIGSAT